MLVGLAITLSLYRIIASYIKIYFKGLVEHFKLYDHRNFEKEMDIVGTHMSQRRKSRHFRHGFFAHKTTNNFCFFSSEMEGMPPAYIVVDMSWDDPEDDLNEIENRKDDNDKIDAKNDKVEDNLDNRIEIKVQEYFQNYWRKHNSPYTHRYRSVLTQLL